MNFVKLGYDQSIVDKMYEYGSDVLNSTLFDKEKQFIQHGNTSTYDHSLCVTYISLWLAERSRHKVDMKSITRGALLHDYFLYDWHEKNEFHRLHGFTHPKRALDNAARDFDLNHIESDIIRKHMFPLTPVPPKHIESSIVCIADKWCAICETFKIDISSYIIYRINLHHDIARGRVRLGHLHKHKENVI